MRGIRSWDKKHKLYCFLSALICGRRKASDFFSGIIEHDTGVCDKKGVRVFEGDIIRWRPNNEMVYMEIVFGGYWKESGFGITDGGEGWDLLNPEYGKIIEVIGNIHEDLSIITTQPPEIFYVP